MAASTMSAMSTVGCWTCGCRSPVRRFMPSPAPAECASRAGHQRVDDDENDKGVDGETDRHGLLFGQAPFLGGEGDGGGKEQRTDDARC